MIISTHLSSLLYLLLFTEKKIHKEIAVDFCRCSRAIFVQVFVSSHRSELAQLPCNKDVVISPHCRARYRQIWCGTQVRTAYRIPDWQSKGPQRLCSKKKIMYISTITTCSCYRSSWICDGICSLLQWLRGTDLTWLKIITWFIVRSYNNCILLPNIRSFLTQAVTSEHLQFKGVAKPHACQLHDS